MRNTYSSNSLPKYALLFLATWIVSGLIHSNSGSYLHTVEAGVTVADDSAETVFTSSSDGKTIYMWQYYSSKPPKFIGQSVAVLSE